MFGWNLKKFNDKILRVICGLLLISVFSISDFSNVFSDDYFPLINKISTNSWSIGLDTDENKIFVADGINNNIIIFGDDEYIKKISLDDDIDCTGHIHGITVDENRIYVVKENDDCIGIYNFDGELIKTFGSKGNKEGEFNSPQSIKNFDGKIYVTDNMNKRIQIYDLQGNFLYSFDIQGNNWNQDILGPYDLEIYQDKIYVTLPKANIIQIYNLQGNFLYSFDKNEVLIDPLGITIKNNMIFVASGDGNEVLILDLEGDLLSRIKSDFKDPHEVIILENKLYVLDTRNFLVKVFSISKIYDSDVKTNLDNVQNNQIYFILFSVTIILILILIKRYYINKNKLRW